MKKFLFVVAVLSIMGCDKEIDLDAYAYFFSQGSQIELEENDGFATAKVNDGENVVFTYSLQREEDPSVTDSSYRESIIFEIPENLDTFLYTDRELLDQNTYFDRSCFCPSEGSIPVEKGTISGTKIDELQWNVTISISFDNFGSPDKRQVDNTFINTITFSFDD